LINIEWFQLCGAALRNANGPSSSIKGQNVFALLEQSGAADEEVELHWDLPKYTRFKMVFFFRFYTLMNFSMNSREQMKTYTF